MPKFVDVSDRAKATKCKANQAAVEAAAAITYADSAMAGNAIFPKKLKAAMFKHGSIPTCPVVTENETEKIKYDKKDGRQGARIIFLLMHGFKGTGLVRSEWYSIPDKRNLIAHQENSVWIKKPSLFFPTKKWNSQ